MMSRNETRHPSVQILQDLLSADPGDAEELRERHCYLCQVNANRDCPDEVRDRECDEARCGLRRPDLLAAKQFWAVLVLKGLQQGGEAAEAAQELFNQQVANAGCLTPALVPGPGGSILGYNAGTLQGAVQLAILVRELHRAGMIMLSVDSISVKGAGHLVGTQHRIRREWRQRRITRLREQGVPDYRIAAHLGITAKSIRDWLGPRTPRPPRHKRP